MPGLEIDLAVLVAWWGDRYEITWDWQNRCFRAVSNRGGHRLEASTPAALWAILRAHAAHHS